MQATWMLCKTATKQGQTTPSRRPRSGKHAQFGQPGVSQLSSLPDMPHTVNAPHITPRGQALLDPGGSRDVDARVGWKDTSTRVEKTVCVCGSADLDLLADAVEAHLGAFALVLLDAQLLHLQLHDLRPSRARTPRHLTTQTLNPKP
eukprot:945692-Rhodomonas_salina.3